MLNLDDQPAQTRVLLDQEGAYILLDPITPKMRRRALSVVRRELVEDGVENPAEMNEDQMGDAGEVVSRELIRMGAVEWGGIGDAKGKVIELTPDHATRVRTATDPERPKGTIDQLLANETFFNLIDERYVRPDAIRRMEKNASSASQTGTGGAGTRGKGTATSRARPKSKAAAKPARTSSTSSKPTKRKASGKS